MSSSLGFCDQKFELRELSLSHEIDVMPLVGPLSNVFFWKKTSWLSKSIFSFESFVVIFSLSNISKFLSLKLSSEFFCSSSLFSSKSSTSFDKTDTESFHVKLSHASSILFSLHNISSSFW